MNKNHNNHKKQNKNPNDFLPKNIKQNNIRQHIPFKYPEIADRKFKEELISNTPFENWPSDEEIIKFNESINDSNQNIFDDINNNQLILPYSLRKQTFNRIIWLRPCDYLKKRNLYNKIRNKFPNKNANYINMKINLAKEYILNYKSNFKYTNESNINSSDAESNENENENENKNILGSVDNLNIAINRRNSIDISETNQQQYFKDFFNSKLNKKEKEIFNCNESENNINLYIVNSKEETELNIKNNKNNHENNSINKKLTPSNMNITSNLSEYCRWISSLFQVLIDNKIFSENNNNHFLKRIYPQNSNGEPIYNPYGRYWIKLFHMGAERKIEIDDKFPVNKYNFESFLPGCQNVNELWPLILTKAIIKLYSYKYRMLYYENNEIGDISIIYSLTKLMGINLNNDLLFSFLKNLENNNIKNLNDLILSNNNEFNYDLLIGYYSNNKNKTSDTNTISTIDITRKKIFPILINNNKKSFIRNNNNSNLNKDNLLTNVDQKKKIKSIKHFCLSPNRVFYLNKSKLKFNHGHKFPEFSVGRPEFSQNKIIFLDNGIMPDICYSISEIFMSNEFNLKRTKPIKFDDLKLDVKVKFKQMDLNEKVIYFKQIKDLMKKQKMEKKIRTEEYLSKTNNKLLIKINNNCLLIDNDIENAPKNLSNKIITEFSLKEVISAKFCIKNNLPFLPEKYFKDLFVEKVIKNEDSGEVNFWTKNFYQRLLNKYFKELGDNSGNDLLEEFKKKSEKLYPELENEIINNTQGSWMNNESFISSFNNFIIYKNIETFKFSLYIDNIYYNYSNDLFEQKSTTNMIYLIRDSEMENNVSINNAFSESELYIIFEANGEKSSKSVSSELEYIKNSITIKGNKFDDMEYNISLIVYSISNNEIENDNNKQAQKIKIINLNGFYHCINIDLNDNNNLNEYFIVLEGTQCPFGYTMQLYSNIYSMKNYSYSEFLINYENYTEKKINCNHEILPKNKFYLLLNIFVDFEVKSDQEENINDSVKLYNILDYSDIYIKNNIDIFLINTETNKKIHFFEKKIIDIDFKNCPRYIIELSIIPPDNIPKKEFNFILLYNNPNINISVCECVPPFYIREKYIPNNHLILFNELIFPAKKSLVTLDISLEYRPNNSEKIKNKKENNELPEERELPFNIPIILFYSHGDNLIYKKNFDNNVIMRNLIMDIDVEKKNNNKNNKINENNFNDIKYNTYIIKCIIDENKCPSYFKNISEYKNDIYWCITVFTNEQLIFVKNTTKEDIENALKEGWEKKEPGRGLRASMSRKKYFAYLKFKNGEMLSPEEEEILNMKRSFQPIDTTGKTILTTVPTKILNENNVNNKISKKNNKSNNNKKENNNNNGDKNLIKENSINDISKKLPKIKKYFSFVLKNFYDYSKNENRLIKNCCSINNLPNIVKCCKTPEEKQKEIKTIEENFEKYNNIKTLENEKIIQGKVLYKKQMNSILKNILTHRNKTKLKIKDKEKKYKHILKINNINLEKLKNIKELLDKINENENTPNDDIFVRWYENYKKFITEKDLNKKCNEILMEIKNKLINILEYKITCELKKIEENNTNKKTKSKSNHKEKNKKNNKLKFYINIVNEKFLNNGKLEKLIQGVVIN